MHTKRDFADALRILVSVALLAPPAAPQTAASRPVVVTPGTPSIWSMEQAHYLLNRLRSNNDAIRSPLPGEADLDPNAVHGLRLEAVASRLGVAGNFEQIPALKNKLALQDHAAGVARQAADRPRVSAMRESLAADQGELAKRRGQKAKLEKQKAAIPAGGPANPEIDAALGEVEGNIVELEERIKVTKEQIAEASVAVAAPSLEAVEPGSVPDALPKQLDGIVKDLMKKTSDAFSSPKLHASTALDNYLRMQYEIVAKQLTTLRDEAGRGQRIVFLELPTSISSADRRVIGQGGEDQLAQAWWRVRRILRRYKIEDSPCWQGVEKPERLYWGTGMDDASFDSLYEIVKFKDQGGQPLAGRAQQAADDQRTALDKATAHAEKMLARAEGVFEEILAIKELNDVPVVKTGAITAEDHFKQWEQDEKRYRQRLKEAGTQVRDAMQRVAGAREAYYWQLNGAPEGDVKRIESECVQLGKQFDAEDEEWDQRMSRMRAARNEKGLSKEEKQFAADLYDMLQSIDDLRDHRREYEMERQQAGLVRALGGTRYLSGASLTEIAGQERTGLVRSVELIPSQTSLNVNSAHALTKESAFSGAAKFLFGFGLKVDYQKQHEKYSQFMQQETFASGFGKGKATFGWTFGPNPGTRVLNSGIRSTFVVLAIPDDVTAIEFESVGCAFNRKDNPPEGYPGKDLDRNKVRCGTSVTTLVGVPNPTNSGGFWPEGIEYSKGKRGAPAVVMLKGKYFSPQVTVLVNGRRLTQVVGLGKPKQSMETGSTPEPAPPEGEISGTFEYVSESNLALQLNVPLKYDGPDFPTITLLAPRRVININRLPLRINGTSGRLDRGRSLFEAPPEPSKPGLALSSFRFLGVMGGMASGYLTGTALDGVKQARLNGEVCATAEPVSSALLRVECKVSELPEWSFLASSDTEAQKAKVALLPVANPMQLMITSQRAIESETVYEKQVPKQVTVALAGLGFTPAVRLKLAAGQENRLSLSYVSPTELRCLILKPEQQETVTITLGGRSASIDVPRPANQPDAPLTSRTSKKTLTKQEETVVTKN